LRINFRCRHAGGHGGVRITKGDLMKKKKIDKLIRKRIQEAIPLIKGVVMAQIAAHNKMDQPADGAVAKTLPLVRRDNNGGTIYGAY
jgi:hypothetical protein